MAPRLPDRYEAHVRLGRDGDIDEWLATDTALDRPVLVRVLDPDAEERRRSGFIAAVRAAAAAHHVHLAEVYAVGSADDPYSILEWHGGVSVADRLKANDVFPVDEFLPNAAGLCEGLHTLHAAGGRHGGIDVSAIGFASAHPAKLTAFGRTEGLGDPATDVAALANALRTGVTGSADPGVAPSQVAGGLPTAVDRALDAAERGEVDAAGLGAALRAIPSRSTPPPTIRWSWTWLVISAVLIAASFSIAVAARGIDVDPDSPFLYPAAPVQAPPGDDPPPSVTTTAVTPSDDRLPVVAATYDPEGDGTERDGDLGLLTDGDPDTAWRTERYFSPLGTVKGGVGVSFSVEGAPSIVEIVATAGTRYEIAWSASLPPARSGWTTVASGTTLAGPSRVQLPPRDGGVWLLWLRDLPESGDGEYTSHVTEVRFLP